MQFKAALATLFIAAAAAQQSPEDLLAELPVCALTCLPAAAKGVGCDATDFECQCAQQDKLMAAAKPCVDKACKPDDVKKAQEVSGEICQAVTGSSSSASASGSASAASNSSSSAATSSVSAAGPDVTNAAPLVSGLGWMGAVAIAAALV